MAKHPLLQKKEAGSGWNLCDPNGGASGEGKTRDGLNKVLEQSRANTKAMRVASADVMKKSAERKYPDTAQGAIIALKDLSVHDTKGATARPDPSIEGVWLVTHKGGQSIVYLAGYRESHGGIRKSNDFEDVEPKEAAVDEDNPMCICGKDFYSHDERGQIWIDDNNCACNGFMPVEDKRDKTIKRMVKDLGPIKFTGKQAAVNLEEVMKKQPQSWNDMGYDEKDPDRQVPFHCTRCGEPFTAENYGFIDRNGLPVHAKCGKPGETEEYANANGGNGYQLSPKYFAWWHQKPWEQKSGAVRPTDRSYLQALANGGFLVQETYQTGGRFPSEATRNRLVIEEDGEQIQKVITVATFFGLLENGLIEQTGTQGGGDRVKVYGLSAKGRAAVTPKTSGMKFTAKFLRRAGGQEFWVTQKGKDAQDAYQKARKEAEREYGHQQGYSGHINSTYRMYMITPPKGIPPQQYAQMCMEYRAERSDEDWRLNRPGKYPKSISVNREVEVKDGQKCPRCKTGVLAVTKREWQPGKFLGDVKCSTPNCAINHNYRRDEKGRVFINMDRNIDTRRFPTLERDARLAQDKGNACCIALNSRTFLFFGIAPS